MTPHASRPPPHVHALVALCVLNHVALSGARVALALHLLQLGVPAFGLGMMLAPFALTSALGALPLGRWVDRVGARVPALAGMALTTIALGVSAWRVDRVALPLAAVVIGLGYTASLIALQSELARDRSDAQRASGFAGFAIGTAASGGFGPFVAGQCMAHGGARLAFAVLAFVSFAASCGAAWNARRLSCLANASRTDATDVAAPLVSRATLSGFGGLRRVLAADLLMGFAWSANSFVVPLVGQRLGWSADVVGDLLASFGAAVMGVRLLPAAWRTRGGHWRAIERALLASGAALALLPLATAMPWPYALQAVLGCGLGGSLPSVLALIHARSPTGRGAEVLGLRQTVLSVGAATLPTALGALVAAIGLAAGLAAFGGSLLAAAAIIAPRFSMRRADAP